MAILLAAGGTFGVAATPVEAQTGPPQVSVAPANALSDTQMAKVDWSGFPSSGSTNVRQCAAGATDPNTQCTGILFRSFTQRNGDGNGAYARLAFGDVLAPSASFRCDPDAACEIRVEVLDAQGGTAFTGTAPLPASIFSKVFAPCPQGAAPLTASGASAAVGAMEAWTRDVCNPPRSLTVDYTPQSSSTGRQAFIDRRFDYTVTGTPFTADELDRLRQDGGRDQRFVYVPITAGSLVFAFNFWVTDPAHPDFSTQVRDLCVSADTVARLFNGTQSTLHNVGGPKTLIEQDNPNIKFPDGAFVHPVGRADASNATLQMTSWFYSDPAAKAAWEDAGSAFKTGPTEILPSVVGTDNRTGARSVARQVSEARNFRSANGTVFGVPFDFVFGVMDLSTARQLGLPVAKVRTKRTDACVDPTDQNVAAGVGAMQTNADGVTRSPDFSVHSASVYPLPTVNYALASTDGVPSDASKNDTLRGLLDYALGDGQVLAAERGYVPLPADMVTQGRAALARLPGSPGSAAADVGADSSENAGLGNFDAGGGTAQLPAGSPLTPSGPGSVNAATPGGARNSGGSGYAGNNATDTSGNALTRFLGSDKALPVILLVLLALAAILGGPIMRLVSRRRTGG